MNELTAVRELGAGLDPATEGSPPGLRHRVLDGFHEPRPHRRRWRVPVGWSLAASGALAAGLVVALVFAGAGARPGPSTLTANDVLTRAAAHVRAEASVTPRPEQLLYVKSLEVFPNDGIEGPLRTKIRESWTSIDGTHDGLIQDSAVPGKPLPDILNLNVPRPGCRNGQQAIVDQHDKVVPNRFQECTPRPAYRPDLPTDGAGMLTYLRKEAKGYDGAVFAEARGLLLEHYLTSAQLAAVFEAVSRLSRVVVVPSVVDLNGRPGIAVAWLVPPFDPELKSWDKPPVAQQQLVFDPNTYAFLGYQDVTLIAQRGHQPGETEWGMAELKKALVDNVGQQP